MVITSVFSKQLDEFLFSACWEREFSELANGTNHAFEIRINGFCALRRPSSKVRKSHVIELSISQGMPEKPDLDRIRLLFFCKRGSKNGQDT